MEVKFGQIVFSKAGHDKDVTYIVIGRDKDRIFLADGKYKTIEKPKCKNIKHIQPTKHIEESLLNKQSEGLLRNEDIKRTIKIFLNNNQ